MIHLDEFLWSFSFISFLLHFLQALKKAISMALSCNSPPPSSSSSSSSSATTTTTTSPLSWMGLRSPRVVPKGVTLAPENHAMQNSSYEAHKAEADSPVLVSKSLVFTSQEYSQESLCSNMHLEEKSPFRKHNYIAQSLLLSTDDFLHNRNQQENLHSSRQELLLLNGFGLESIEENSCSHKCGPKENYSGRILASQGLNNCTPTIKSGDVKVSSKVRKRPAKIAIPEALVGWDFSEVDESLTNKVFEVQGRDFFLACKRGRREVMEDGYEVITDIGRDPKQAFFGVFDGHGGRAAVDYVAENIGKNIIIALGAVEKEEHQLEQAIREGYLTTDKEFLSKGVSSGACAATVLLKDGELHIANAGDCRVVLSRKGVADALTSDHRVNREDERFRIENSGGYVNCCNGVWRAQGSLAVSRAIGDLHLKEWIISEPEIKNLPLTSDCEFLIMASDGLWDKVTNQEAVDVVLRHKISIESCQKLVDLSSSRGNKDDVTVMVIDLQNFAMNGGFG